MSDLFDHLVTALRTIEAAAVPCSGGSPTGIRGYCDHVNPERRDTRNVVENLWSDTIADHLRRDGYQATTQVRYASYNGWCDLVLRSQKEHIWIEVKGEWREEVFPAGPRSNKNYRKYIISTASDIDKLQTITKGDGTHVGLLVLGFDRAAMPIAELDLTPIFDRMRPHKWNEQHTLWDDPWFTGFRVHVWFWQRPL